MKTNTEKLEFWKRHSSACKESNLTIVEYCESAGLNRHTFQYWREKFQKENLVKPQVPEPVFVRVAVAKAKPVAVNERFAETVARLRLGRATTLECLSWPEPEWLAKVSDAVGSSHD